MEEREKYLDELNDDDIVCFPFISHPMKKKDYLEIKKIVDEFTHKNKNDNDTEVQHDD